MKYLPSYLKTLGRAENSENKLISALVDQSLVPYSSLSFYEHLILQHPYISKQKADIHLKLYNTFF